MLYADMKYFIIFGSVFYKNISDTVKRCVVWNIDNDPHIQLYCLQYLRQLIQIHT